MTPDPRARPESPDGFLKDLCFCGCPVVAGSEAIAFKNQERPERQADMRALCLRLSALAALYIRYLLQAPMILLDFPTRFGKLQPSQFIHLQIVGSPVLRRTVLGNDPEHLHHPIVLQMDYRAGCGAGIRFQDLGSDFPEKKHG